MFTNNISNLNMKKILLIIASITCIVWNTRAQINNNCILPYRMLSETTGEKYLVLSHGDTNDEYTGFKRTDHPNKKLSNHDLCGKILTVVSESYNTYSFVDSDNYTYTYENYGGGDIYFLLNITDVDNTKKLFLNKSLWINDNKVLKPYNKFSKILPARFERVTVINILPGDYHGTPVKFIVKTAKGDTSECSLNVSDTNRGDSMFNDGDDYRFGSVFFVKDPKVTYHLSATAWAAVRAKKIYLGMPGDALRLVKGVPDKINRTTTAYAISEQWVYGYSYYYFKNNKLTTIQD